MAPLIGTCPRCHGAAPIGAFLTHDGARTAWDLLVARLAAHPALLTRVLPYLDLHAPVEHTMHWPKAARLIGELVDLILAPTVRGPAGPLPITPAHWALAMDAAADAHQAGTLRVPLPDGFGWLKTVAAAKAADPAAALALAALAAATPAPGAMPPPAPVADLRELRADLAALRQLERYNPNTHTAAIADLETRIAALTKTLWGEAAP
ncbi:hypothetical protein [Lamprocystis purpurea]|jgi:hypothetical protein|uniref:hypothetical protein n=1 Tax=Lamprocystis purpurea TaxID=61598 RepID=UPI000367E523|nr:hypothetical protein [Lamprocystis purpurea]